MKKIMIAFFLVSMALGVSSFAGGGRQVLHFNHEDPEMQQAQFIDLGYDLSRLVHDAILYGVFYDANGKYWKAPSGETFSWSEWRGLSRFTKDKAGGYVDRVVINKVVRTPEAFEKKFAIMARRFLIKYAVHHPLSKSNLKEILDGLDLRLFTGMGAMEPLVKWRNGLEARYNGGVSQFTQHAISSLRETVLALRNKVLEEVERNPENTSAGSSFWPFSKVRIVGFDDINHPDEAVVLVNTKLEMDAFTQLRIRRVLKENRSLDPGCDGLKK